MIEKFNERQFVKSNFDNFMFIDGIGGFNWNGKFWEPISENKIKRVISTKLNGKVEEHKITSRLINSIYMAMIIHKSHDNDKTNLNENNEILFLNGVYNIRERVFYKDKFVKSEYRTRTLTCNYVEGELDTFNKYLSSTFKGNEDCIPLIQEMMGYILYPSCKYEKAFIFSGSGGNGKSVLLNVIQELIGEKNTSYISMRDLQKSFYRSMLYNKTLNVSSELEDSISHTENFKKLVSGESVEAQFKFKDSFHFQNRATLLFAMNNMPVMRDLSDGIFRRLITIPFINSFKDEDRDVDLFSKLKKEKDAIAFWAIQGLERLLENGKFTEPQSVVATINELKIDNMPILRFAEDTITITNKDKDTVTKQDLYSAYSDWCSDNGNRPMNSNNFYRQVKEQLTEIEEKRVTVDGKRIRLYTGLKLEGVDEVCF